MTLLQRLQATLQRHTDFTLLLILFITFRLLALVAYRPGGLVLDFSDFYWYRSFAELTRQGYYPYDNLWTTYPPLFPVVMIALYQLSTLLPPWEYANLWFTLMLGSFFLLFETGNFVLLYLLALKLYPLADGVTGNTTAAIRVCWIYAAFFVPVYTLTGWFESYPLFFFLLSLYLLLINRPYLSAFFTGVGFMIKLIPIILLPVAVQLLARTRYQLVLSRGRLTFSPYRPPVAPDRTRFSPFLLRNFRIILPYDPTRFANYLAIFLATVILIGLPFYLMNPDLIFGSQQITGARQPWETIWALIDGNYDYGVIPLDMRDLAWAPDDAPASRIPWSLVTLAFGLVYGLFYTRPLAWSRTQQRLAFVAFTLCLFMLWSKGYSPQWLGWPLFFTALLLPNSRGVIYAAILSLSNILEANFFFIMFPEERWLLVGTVLTRTFLLTVLALEFLLLVWPQMVTEQVEQVRHWGLAAFVGLLLVAAAPAGWLLGQSYFETRLQQSPYRATIVRLQDEPVSGVLLLNSQQVYDWFYPYLRDRYTLYLLDDYDPPAYPVEAHTTDLLNRIAQQTAVLWLYDANPAETTPAEETLNDWLDDLPEAHIQDIDGGRLQLFILNEAEKNEGSN